MKPCFSVHFKVVYTTYLDIFSQVCNVSNHITLPVYLWMTFFLQDLTNVDIFLQSKRIEEALLRHETGPCLAWCYENKTKLRKSQR